MWFRIPKESTPLPSQGHFYYDWKSELSEEGKNQCVYCTIHTKSFGGIRNFHVEHFRPKSVDRFKHLKHDYKNLFFSCSICNCFKGNDWPNDPNPEFDNNSYPDPSEIDYSILWTINKDYVLESNYITGKYIIQRIFLNRPQLIMERKKVQLSDELRLELGKLNETIKLIQTIDPSNILLKPFVTLIETTSLMLNEDFIIPYTAEQITR